MATQHSDSLLQQVAALPTLPGVYRFFAVDEQLLYVGKARSLKKRVSSYFQKDHQGTRIGLMVSKIARLETTVVRTETEALLLENNLIKTLQPKFNIVFRDDKSYPYLKISKHKYPRLVYYRGKIDNKQHYFGPYPNAHAVKETISLLQKVFLLRNCEDTVFANRSRPCLLYQIKRCSAPCMVAALQQHNPVVEIQPHWQQHAKQLSYQQDVDNAINFLQGNTSNLLEQLQQRMQQHSQALEFEQAALTRNQISALSSVLQNQAMELSSTNANQSDVDVLAVSVHGGRACVNLAMIRGGRHLGDRAFFPTQIDDAMAIAQLEQQTTANLPNNWVAQQVLQAFVLQHYVDQYTPSILLISEKLELKVQTILTEQAKHRVQLIHQPQGQRKLWLTMAEKNAKIQLQHLLSQEGSQRQRTLALVTALDLEVEPEKNDLAEFRVECFDISHTSGEATQASCVVYQNHSMQSSQYRRYNIADITPGDDYAAMHQVLQRRYSKIAEQLKLQLAQQHLPKEQQDEQLFKLNMPNLVLVDGGKGQVSMARQVFEDLGLDVSLIVGVEKGDKRKVGLEELVFADGRAKVYLGKDSAALLLIAQIRDEAHRFAITGMRAKRASVRTGASQLEEIVGIGAKRRADLLKRFGGVRGVSGASVEELASVSGISLDLAEHIYAALH